MGTPAALRVAEYRFVSYRRVWRLSVVNAFANPVLFLLAMGLGVGSLIDANNPSSLEGYDYLAYLAPGLLAATMMNIAAVESTYPILSSVKWTPVAFGQVATPLRPADIGVGQLIYISVRMFGAASVFVVVMIVFGAVESWGVVLAIPAAVLTGMAFSAPLVGWSITLEQDYRFPPLQRFVIMPMFLFSGTFFPVDQLPALLRPIAYITPLWHGVRLCRGLTLGEIVAWEALAHTVVLLAFVAVGTALVLRNYPKRLTW